MDFGNNLETSPKNHDCVETNLLDVKVWLFFILSCLAFPLFGKGTAVLTPDIAQVIIEDDNIWSSTQLPSNRDANEWLASDFQPLKDHSILLGQSGAVIAKVDIKTTEPGHWYIVPTANFVDRGYAYWLDTSGNWSLISDFSQVDNLGQYNLAHSQAFRLSLNTATQGQLWLLLSADYFPTPADITVYREDQFFSAQLTVNTFTALSISGMLVLGIMSLVVFFRTRHKVALYCAGYVGLHGVGWAFAAGIIQSFWSTAPVNTTYGGMYLFPFAIACASYFAYQLFDLQNANLKIGRFLVQFSIVATIIGFVGVFLPFSIIFYLSHCLASVWIVLSIYVGATMLSKNDFRGKYFLTGNVLYSLSLTYYIFSHLDVMDLPQPELVVLAALAVDCICILLSLSEWLRIKQLEHQSVFQQSRIDPLTGVGNRQMLNDALVSLDGDYIAVFIDCDCIKSVNDELGHAEGDLFLVYVADLMTREVKNLGQVYRSGGDEFIWICHTDHVNQLANLVVDVKARLDKIDQVISNRWPQSGISYGIATSHESSSPSNCLSQADSRMYVNKSERKQAMV